MVSHNRASMFGKTICQVNLILELDVVLYSNLRSVLYDCKCILVHCHHPWRHDQCSMDPSCLHLGHCRFVHLTPGLIQAFLLLSGSLSDIFGRKAFFIMGSTLGFVASIVGATAKSTNQIIAFMAMMGVATAFTRYISLERTFNIVLRHPPSLKLFHKGTEDLPLALSNFHHYHGSCFHL
jgi:hypothetical protein